MVTFWLCSDPEMSPEGVRIFLPEDGEEKPDPDKEKSKPFLKQ